jgi:hypothetical protein
MIEFVTDLSPAWRRSNESIKVNAIVLSERWLPAVAPPCLFALNSSIESGAETSFRGHLPVHHGRFAPAQLAASAAVDFASAAVLDEPVAHPR